MNKTNSKYINGLEEIISLYDAFLIDQWGVIHNGNYIYDGVDKVLINLAKLNKEVIILTNSSKTEEVNVIRLCKEFGIKPFMYTKVVSSAHVLIDLINKKNGNIWSELGTNVFLVAIQKDKDILYKTDLTIVEDVAKADFVMLLSVDENVNLESNLEWMNIALSKNIPLLCPSEDLQSVSPNGIFPGMATIVKNYKKEGGKIINSGKPYSYMYEESKKIIGKYEKDRVLAIGDQVYSDVIGAKRHGYHALLVNTGARENRLSTYDKKVRELLKIQDDDLLIPNWILPSLRW